jgi:curli biogenesis system outer membrane secretion channel CsgG
MRHPALILCCGLSAATALAAASGAPPRVSASRLHAPSASVAPVAAITPWRPTLAVLPFSDRSSGEWLLWTGRDVGEGLARWIADSLSCDRDWRLPDTARVAEAFMARRRTELLSDANAVALGASLGAELAMTGVVTEFAVSETPPDLRALRWGVGSGRRRTTATVTIELRLLDCTNGAVVRAATIQREQQSQSSSSADAPDRIDRRAFVGTPLGIAAREAVAAAVHLLDEERIARTSVRVARIEAGSVWLDAGRARGLAPGQRLVVMRPEVVTLDPADGAMVPESEHIVAELRVMGFADGPGRPAHCRLERGVVEPGDVVQLVAERASAARAASPRRTPASEPARPSTSDE